MIATSHCSNIKVTLREHLHATISTLPFAPRVPAVHLCKKQLVVAICNYYFCQYICEPFFWYFSLRCSLRRVPLQRRVPTMGTFQAPPWCRWDTSWSHHIRTGITVIRLLLWTGTDTETGSGVPLAVRIFSCFWGMVSPWQDKYVYRKESMVSEGVISVFRVLTSFQKGAGWIPCWKIHSHDGSSRAGGFLPKARLWRAI